MNILCSFFKSQVSGSDTLNKIKPVDSLDQKYYELLQTVSRGSLLTNEELKFIARLPKDKIFTILKLYNINFYNLKNNIVHVEMGLG